jgi:hypothetical protein
METLWPQECSPDSPSALCVTSGFAVDLTTHVTKRMGAFVWIAEPIFDEEPTEAEVTTVGAWRWPVWLPLGAMVRRKLVIPLGLVSIQPELRSYPIMRGGLGHQWKRAAVTEDGTTQILPGETDPSLPINQIVNDTRLKEMLVTGWRSEDHW